MHSCLLLYLISYYISILSQIKSINSYEHYDQKKRLAYYGVLTQTDHQLRMRTSDATLLWQTTGSSLESFHQLSAGKIFT
jgi:hypothetical protein